MMINFELPPYKIDPHIVNEFIEKEIHLVSSAVKKNGFCTHYLSKRGMSSYEIGPLCDIVNNKNEVGTLYPKFSFSLFPVRHTTTELQQQIDAYLLDVLIAHCQYYPNCKSLHWVFDQAAGYPEGEIKTLLNHALHTIFSSRIEKIKEKTKIPVDQIQQMLMTIEYNYSFYIS